MRPNSKNKLGIETNDRGGRIARIGVALLLAVVFCFLSTVSAHAAWYDSNWQYRKKLTIDYTKVGASLSNFPVVVSLTSDSDLAAGARSDGYDILFTSSDGTTKLDHEIESYTSGTGALVAWVKIPSLSNSADTEIYMYYGNAGASNQQNKTGVWSNGYAGVWHLSNNDFTDSTSNANNGTNSGTTDATGQIAGGRQGNASNNYIRVADHASLEPSDDMTFSIWVKLDSIPYETRFVQKEHSGTPWQSYVFTVGTNGIVTFGWTNSGGNYWPVTSSTTISTGTWQHVAGVRSSGTLRIYLNGTDVSNSPVSTTGTIYDSNGFMTIGNNGNFTHFPDGVIDEVRLSSSGRSAEWISTEYNNQSNPGPGTDAFFRSLGNEETESAPTGYSFRRAITIQGDQIGSNCSSSLTDFPVLISITGEDYLKTAPTGKVESSNGYDIIFKDSDGNQLDHEVEKYDGTAGDLVAWVRIPTLSNSADTPIYMYYGNSIIASPTENPEGVWNADYIGVWHLSEQGDGAADEFKDSTANANHARGGRGDSGKTPTRVNTGPLGVAQRFARTNETVIEAPHSTSLNMTGVHTLSAWVLGTGATIDYEGLMGKGDDTYQVRRSSPTANTNLRYDVRGGSGDVDLSSTINSFPQDEFKLIHVVYDGSQMRIYLQGSQDVQTDRSGTMGTNSLGLQIGANADTSNNLRRWWNGDIAEVRISNIARDACWIETEYNNQNSPETFYEVGSEEPLNFNYRKEITIDRTKVACGTMSDFPMVVSIASDNNLRTVSNGGHVENSSGYDIIFRDSDGITQLDHELVRYTPTSGELIAWVRIPTLTSSGKIIYMYYGNSAVTEPTENPTGVWDSNYKGVWHLEEDPSISTDGRCGGGDKEVCDSTGNNNHGDMHGAMTSGQRIAGKIGYAYDLDGSNDWIQVPHSSSLDITGNQIALEAWARIPSGGTPQDSALIVKGPSMNNERYMLGVDGGVNPERINYRLTTSDGHYRHDEGIYDRTEWVYVVAIYDGTLASNPRFSVYKNGQWVSSSNASGNILTTTADLLLGRRTLDDGRYFNGDFDELRVSDIAREPCWIETSFNNQDDPGDFCVIGPEESTGDLFIGNHAAGQKENAFGTESSVTGAELFAFQLTNNTDSTITVDQVQFQLSSVTGIVQGDFANLAIYVDDNNDGTISGGETTTVGGAGAVDGGVTTITFSTSFNISASATVNYILKGDVSNLSPGDTVTISLGTSTVTLASGAMGGSGATSVTHLAAASGVFMFRKAITIDKDKIGSSCSTALTSFPVLIQIADDTDLRDNVNSADGYDIIFRAMDETLCGDLEPAPCTLDHEIEKWDGSSGSLVAWVRIPTLSNSADSTIYMYYGNAEINESTENKTGVWDADYKGVWHMSDDPTGSEPQMLDSTVNVNHGTAETGSGVVTRVQYQTAIGNPTASATFGATPIQGNVLIAIAATRAGDPGNSASVVSGTGWTKQVENYYYSSTGDRRGLAMFYKIAGAGEATNLQVRWTSSSDTTLIIQEFAIDGGGSFSFDTSTSNNSGTGTVTTLSTGTTTQSAQSDSFLVTGLVHRDTVGDATWTNSVGSNIRYAAGSNVLSSQTAFGTHSTQSTKESTATWSTARHSTAGILVFSITAVGPSRVDGKFAGGVSLDGANDYIYTTNQFNNPQEFTIEAWFKTGSASGRKIIGLETNRTGTGSPNWDRHIWVGTDGRIRFGCYSGATYIAASTGTYVDNEWHHAVGVRNDSTDMLHLYINGTLVGEIANPAAESFNGYWRIGSYKLNGWTNGSDGYFPGSIDEVRVSSIARDVCWIQSSYNNQRYPNKAVNGGDGFLTVGSQESSPPTAVDLTSFKATGQGDNVAVTWETAQEISNLGFHIYRSGSKGGPYVRTTDTVIPGLTFSARGRSYSFLDADVIKWDLYYYKLEDIDIRGKKTMHGPVCVDWDGDGMPDDWEIAHGLNPRVNDAHLDPDGDGLTNLEEYLLGTDPQRPDVIESWMVESLRSVTQSLGKGLEIISSDDTCIILELRTRVFEATVVEHEGEAYDRLRIPEYIHGWTQEMGKPEMPVKGVILDIPEGKSAALQVLSVDSRTEESYWIYPVPDKIAVESGGVVEVQEVFVMDEDAYLRDAYYPDTVAELGETFSYRGGVKQQVLFHPLSFNPRDGSMEFYTRIRVKVVFEGGAVVASSGSGSLAWAPSGSDSADSYKMYVSEEGIYRVTGAWLAGQGVDLDAMTLSALRMYNLGEEIAIHVFDDNGNNLFDAEDYIEFYDREVHADFSKYTNYNVYWLATDGEGTPRRMAVVDGTPGVAPLASTHTFTLRHELDEFYLGQAQGEDDMERWYFGDFALGSAIGGGPTDFRLTVPGVEGSGIGHLVVAMMGLTELEHEVEVKLNGAVLGTYVWSGFAPYETVIGNLNIWEGNNTVTLTCLSGSNPSEPDGVALDYLEIAYPRGFAAQNNSLKFTHEGGYRYEVTGFGGNTVAAYDITLPAEVKRIENIQVAGSGPYTLEMAPAGGAGERTYLAVSSPAVKTPASIKKAVHARLGETSNGADWILITHRDLGWDGGGSPYPWLVNLVALREGQGLQVKVVDVEQACDEFSYGMMGPKGIKNFLIYAYENWTAPAPAYVLLVGDGTYDPKDNWLLGESVPYLPVYLTFTEHMGETASDEWFVRLSGRNGVSDIHIGRLPAATVAQAEAMAGKIVSYESAGNSKTWEKNVLLVADNVTAEYERLFEVMNNDAAKRIPAGMNQPFKEYLEDYGSAWALNAAIMSRMNHDGALIVNYSGHGSTQRWAGENIFEVGDIGALTNSAKLPFFVAMTCLNGDFVEPESFDFPSLAEALMRAPGKGAVAVLTSTGMTLPEGQHVLNVALFEAVFEKDKRRLGEAVTYAKQEVLAHGSRYQDVATTFALFGDPAMRLKVPLPTRPAGVSVSVQEGRVRLSWNKAEDCNGGPVGGYNLYRSGSPGGLYERVNSELITGTGYTESGAVSGTWYYVVRSVDEDGVESSPSAELSVTVGARGVAVDGVGTVSEAGAGGGGCFISTILN